MFAGRVPQLPTLQLSSRKGQRSYFNRSRFGSIRSNPHSAGLGADWPGLSCPEAYFVTRLLGYNVVVVMISHDMDEALGVADLEIAWFNDTNLFERACRMTICRHWKAWAASHSQPEWEAFVAEGCIDERTATAWARLVRWTRW
jgi:hypothetical protein